MPVAQSLGAGSTTRKQAAGKRAKSLTSAPSVFYDYGYDFEDRCQSKPETIRAVDFGGDRSADLVVGSRATIFLLLNQGDGINFAPTSLSQRWSSLQVADLDGDGNADTLTSDPIAAVVSVFVNDGSGAFRSQREVGVGVLQLGQGGV